MNAHLRGNRLEKWRQAAQISAAAWTRGGRRAKGPSPLPSCASGWCATCMCWCICNFPGHIYQSFRVHHHHCLRLRLSQPITPFNGRGDHRDSRHVGHVGRKQGKRMKKKTVLSVRHQPFLPFHPIVTLVTASFPPLWRGAAVPLGACPSGSAKFTVVYSGEPLTSPWRPISKGSVIIHVFSVHVYL